MPRVIAAIRDETAQHHGKECEVLRAVTPDDGRAFDVKVAKSVVEFADGTEFIVLNDEIRG